MAFFRLRYVQRDRINMLDAIWTVGTTHAQEELTKAVMLIDKPQAPYVEHLLYMIGGSDHLPSEVC